MKIQDIFFIILVLFLVYKRNPRWLVITGIISLILSIPLFSLWVFFTAQRLVYYAAGFFLAAVILILIKQKRRK